ncbi:hypothetical protein ACNKHU_23270 [Shigella flexneri]
MAQAGIFHPVSHIGIPDADVAMTKSTSLMPLRIGGVTDTRCRCFGSLPAGDPSCSAVVLVNLIQTDHDQAVDRSSRRPPLNNQPKIVVVLVMDGVIDEN